MNDSNSVDQKNGIFNNPNFETNNRRAIPNSSTGTDLRGESIVYTSNRIMNDAETLLKEQWFKKLENKYIPSSSEETKVSNDITGIKDTLKSRILGENIAPQRKLLTPELIKAPSMIGLDGKPLNKEEQEDRPKIIESIKDLKEPTSLAMAQMQETINSEIRKEISINTKKTLDSGTMTKEIIKCRMSALYFIENYVSVPVAGGRVSMKESEQWNATNKYKIIIELFQQYDSVLYMSSRQSGKTTTSAMYLLWCMIFFPKIQISYLTLDKNRAIDMISRMKEMMDSLPKWLQVRPKSNAERLSYYELSNGSKITASFVSGSNDPDKVGRGLSSPIVFIDETAFIPHAEIVWGALQPSVSAAKQFAKRNGYPNGVIFTSTPNGAGDNFFYNVYQNSVKFDDIYNYEDKCLY